MLGKWFHKEPRLLVLDEPFVLVVRVEPLWSVVLGTWTQVPYAQACPSEASAREGRRMLLGA